MFSGFLLGILLFEELDRFRANIFAAVAIGFLRVFNLL